MNLETTGFVGRIAHLLAVPGAARTSQRRSAASPWKRWILVAAVLGVAVSTAFSALGQGQTAQKLFFIQRSKSADEVHYDARVNADGSLDPKDPVEGYWLNKASDGSRSSITFFQKIAYGFDTEPTGNGTYALKLRAFKDRPMWIVKGNGKWRVQTTIAGKQAFMSRIYVATDESGVMPKVLYVDVFGEDMASGAALTEHIVKK
jgi:hypothetical protein